MGKIQLPLAPQQLCHLHTQMIEHTNELHGLIGGLAADVSAVARRQKRHSQGQWAIGILVAIIGIAIPAITAVQVARIATVKSAQSDYAAEQQRQRDQAALESKISSQLSELRTAIEQQRRGYPAPMGQK